MTKPTSTSRRRRSKSSRYRANETTAQRNRRLQRDAASHRQRRTTESATENERRLSALTVSSESRRLNESRQQADTEQRRNTNARRQAQRSDRNINCISLTTTVSEFQELMPNVDKNPIEFFRDSQQDIAKSLLPEPWI